MDLRQGSSEIVMIGLEFGMGIDALSGELERVESADLCIPGFIVFEPFPLLDLSAIRRQSASAGRIL